MELSNVIIYKTVLVLTLVGGYLCQGTIQSSSCTIDGDDSNIYTIQLNTSPQRGGCGDVNTLTEQLKDANTRYSELESDIVQLKDIVRQLQDTNTRLVTTVSKLESDIEELRNTSVSSKEDITDDITHEVTPGGPAPPYDDRGHVGEPDDGDGSTEDGEPGEVTLECPQNYHIRNDDYNSCYMFVNWYLTWYEAETYCMGSGGHLVSFQTREEEDYIVQQITDRNGFGGVNVWTGANDISSEGLWSWVGTNEPVNHTTWLVYNHPEHGPINQPDNHMDQEHCMDLFHADSYKWNDQACVHEYYAICEYKLQ